MSKIQVLGSGCAKCKTLAANTAAAIHELGIEALVEKVEDMQTIVGLGVLTPPALVVDGKVVSYGKVLKRDEVATILKRERGL